jgi:hemoglobin/transferrin/lactoferrin receptor protein
MPASRKQSTRFGVVMVGLKTRVRAPLLSVSVFALAAVVGITTVEAQSAPPVEQGAKDTQQKPRQAKRKRATAPMAEVPVPRNPMNANAQIGQPVYQPLDEITVAASKTNERAIDALAPVSVVTLEQIQGRQATRVGDLVYNVPGVWLQDRGDDPSTSINIRGLQDFGRVAVVVDGARQNYQRTGHFANGSFFLNPELIGGIDIVRGPTANIYGSGAIGGVASFRTKDIQDVVRPGERWGVDASTILGTNRGRALGSIFGGVRVNPNVDFFAGGTYSTMENYKDGTGYEVANTGNRLSAGIAKLTVRPADGHEVKLGGIFQEDSYRNGQPPRLAGDPNSTNPNGTNNLSGTSIYGTTVRNYTTTLGWTYARPDDKLFDWNAKIYWNRTENEQIKLANASNSNPPGATGSRCRTLGLQGNNVTGCVGDERSYRIDTYGFDAYNTSRIDAGDFRHAFTYGADGFLDRVNSIDTGGTADLTTPNGERTVLGAFAQWKLNYASLVEVISAARYDNYRLNSNIGGGSGDRLSPKVTIGLMPAAVLTPYVSYAEGYRAPSVTETLVNGAHVSATPNDAFFSCPSGTSPGPNTFCFVPNPNLRPEIGKTKEIGLNVKKNDLFKVGDSFRGKFNIFRNDVSDYIDQVSFGTPVNLGQFGTFSPFVQYQNVASARIQGFEAETMYDAQAWFAGVALTLQEGKNLKTNIGLYSVQPQKVTTTAGLRFLDGQVVFTAMWTSVKANTDIPANYLPNTSYDLVNLYLSVKPTPNLTMTASVENLLNQYYRPYAVPGGTSGESQNDVKWASAGAGITFKGGLKYHFGGT